MDRNGLIAHLSEKPGLRLGIMGGAFDPIHMAHLVIAEEALLQFDLDQVVFMPAGDPPHKDRHMAPAEFRYLLVSVATAGNPKFSVSRFEIDRGGVSYTVDTHRGGRRPRHPHVERPGEGARAGDLHRGHAAGP
jgi:nicotinate-nucleotide adenylyltransferase